MTSFLIVLIIFLIGCGCSSAKEKARVAKLKENKTNFPLQQRLKRRIFNQMIPEYIEEYEKRFGDIGDSQYNNKEILDILAKKYNIPTRSEIRDMGRISMYCWNLQDLANLYAECQVAKQGYTAVTCRTEELTSRKEPYPSEIPESGFIEVKTAYEIAMSEAENRKKINKKYPGLF